MSADDKAKIIRGIFAAYIANDRTTVEDALADDFRFLVRKTYCGG